jgi:hypothetical protein
MLVEMLPLLVVARAKIIADSAPGAHAMNEPSDETACTKPVFMACLSAWEASRLPAARSPVLAVTSTSSPQYSLVPIMAEDSALLAPTSAEDAIAASAASLLSLPRLHLPSFLSVAAKAHQEQERARAEEEAKRKEAEDKRRKKEEDEAKKALASGGGAKAGKDAKGDKGKRPDTASKAGGGAGLLINPSVDPCGALVQALTRAVEGTYARGFILTGTPCHSSAEARSLSAALSAARMPFTLNLHANETVRIKGVPAERPRRPSVYASERMSSGALQRRNSFLLAAPVRSASTPASLALLPAQAREAPWTGPLGTVAHVEADVRLLARTKRQRAGRAKHTGGGSTVEEAEALVREGMIGVLMREGYLAADPTAPEGEVPGLTPSAALEAVALASLPASGNMGEPNAFSITLFSLAQEQESRSMDLLAAAFEAFPDREYAILTQPFSAPDMPLLRRFVQVQPRQQAAPSETMYLCHRDSLLTPALLNVRRAGPADRAIISALASSLPDGAAFMDAVVASEYRAHQPLAAAVGSPVARIACFVAEVDGSTVGAVVLANTGGEEDALAAACLSFDLDAAIEPQHYASRDAVPASARRNADGSSEGAATAVASLLHMVLSPVLFPAAPSLLRSALRAFGGKHAALFRQPSSALGAHIAAPLPSAVKEHMALVRPRALAELTPAAAEAAAVERSRAADARAEHAGTMDSITRAAYTVAGLSRAELADPRCLDHGLYVFSTRSSTVRRTHVNARIIVVGASDAALAAIATLLLAPGQVLSHVTVVSPGGLPAPVDAFSNPASFVPGREFTAFELSRLPVSSHVTFVDDALAGIHRKEQAISLTASSAASAVEGVSPRRARLWYDALVLLPGLTEATWGMLGFATPDAVPRGMHSLTFSEALGALSVDAEALAAHCAALGDIDDEVIEATPGVAVGSLAANPALAACTDLDAVVYGDSLEALTAINGLLDRGVPGKRILHVRPTSRAFGEGGSSDPALPACAVEVLDDLIPVGTGAALSADGLFTSKAISSVLAAAGVRSILGADVVRVVGHLNQDSESALDADGLPQVTIPGLTLELRLRLLPTVGVEVEAKAAVDASSSSETEEETHSVEDLESESQVDSHRPLAPAPLPTVENVSIPAALLLCAGSRDVDARIFSALDDSGIVYDGRLVVDHNFVATDPAIFAGGSIAKFSRRYRAPLPLSRYDSREVGEAVALSVLRLLRSGSAGNPAAYFAAAAAADAASGATLPSLLPTFNRPKVTRAVLPGNIRYLRARLPRVEPDVRCREIVTFVPPNANAGVGLRFT